MNGFLVLVFLGVFLVAVRSQTDHVGGVNQQHHTEDHKDHNVGGVGSVGSHGNVVPVDRDDTCQAPNKQGLNALIREEMENIPVRQIRELSAQRVRTDPEVRRLAEYWTSSELRTTLRTIQQTSQFTKLQNFACKKLFLNMKNFWELHNSIFDLPNPITQEGPEVVDVTHTDALRGVTGLVRDISKLIPTAQLKRIFLRREKSDEYLRMAVDRLKSVEFRQMLDDVRNLPEYRGMMKKFTELGLPVTDVLAIMRRALGLAETKVLIVESLLLLVTV